MILAIILVLIYLSSFQFLSWGIFRIVAKILGDPSV